jgi:DNA repair exonuclease SbcCD ATPase subunit
MASIIKSISFKNFFNYYGDFDSTRYDFEEGVNIIVADNGAGKSKFFNAFLWLFYDQILDSDDKIKKGIKDVAYKVISDKAKNETSVGGQTQTGIRIEYTTGRFLYQITKSFVATRLQGNLTDQSSWQITFNDLEVDKTDTVLPKYKPVYDVDEKRKIINQLILPNLRQYSFFQGEEVDRIIDFSKKSSIEDAVRTLTNISVYEELSEKINEIAIKAEKDLNKQNKVSTDQSERLDAAIATKESLLEKLEQEEKNLKEFQQLYQEAEQEKNDLEQNFANAEKRKELDDKISAKNRSLKDAKEEYDSFLEGINNKFFDGNFAWITLGFEHVVDDFKNKIKEFRQKRYEKKALQNAAENPGEYFSFLPINSPDAVSLENMIDEEHCFVCDRPAKYGTEPHNYLLKLKNRTNPSSNKKEFVKNDLEDFFGNLQISATPFCNKFENIPQSVLRTKEKEIELRNRVDKINKDVKSLKSQRKDILISGSDDDNGNDSVTIINQYKGAIRRMEQASSRIDRYQGNIKGLRNDISKTQEEIKKLRPQDIPEGYTFSYEISADLAEATEKAKERVFNNMVKLLEKHANNHFQSLIKYNDLSGGVLKFEKSPSGSIIFNYIDKSGNIQSGASTGFQRMKIFSVVMAIISANTSQYNYPLLADAPISEFGDGFIQAFFEETGKIFPQSIVLVKELYNGNDRMKLSDLGKKLLKEDNIKTMYVNSVTEGAEQIDLVTTQTRLK